MRRKGGAISSTRSGADGCQGRVRKFVAQVGDVVHVDQVVAEVDQPQLRQELAAAEGELKDAIDLRTRTADFQQRREAVRSVSSEQRKRALEENIAVLTQN